MSVYLFKPVVPVWGYLNPDTSVGAIKVKQNFNIFFMTSEARYRILAKL
jgi:hypothetical protein